MAVFDNFAEGAAVEGDRGDLVGHRGEQGIVERFEKGGEEKDVEGGINIFDVRDKAGEDHSIGDAELARELFKLRAAGPVTGEEELGIGKIFASLSQRAEEPFLSLVGEQDANAAEKRSVRRNVPAGTSSLALLWCEKPRDFGAFVDDDDFFARSAGCRGLLRDPPGVSDDARRGLIARSGRAAFADGVTDATRDDEGHALVRAGKPGGGNCVGFIGVNGVEAARGEELANVLRGEKPKNTA